MSFRTSSLIFAAFAVVAAGTAQADEAQPLQARSIDLGAVSGSAYYTVEQSGYRVVATFAEGDAGTPVRVTSVLAPGQSIVVSAPRASGIEPVSVEIRREADAVFVDGPAALMN